MAVIDTFLKLLVTQRAECLVLVPDETPALLVGDQATELPMPAIPAALSQRLVQEIVGPQQIEGLSLDLPVEGIYRNDEGEEFTYQVSRESSGCRIEMRTVPAEGDRVEATPIAPSKAEAAPIAAAPPRPGAPLASVGAVPPDRRILSALESALQANASDVFLSSGKPPQMRMDGVIRPLGDVLASDAQILALLPRDDCHRELESSGSVDFGASWELQGRRARFRVNVFRHSNGLAAALRPIRSRIPSLQDLHLPPELLDLCSWPSGLVLVTGASGSGKSTTLAALLDHINRTTARHIITIEDPIEFEHSDHKSLVHQREVGSDVESFSSGLRAGLRENPDVILLGEMRDLPTISAALTAAETGHLVLSTLHTGNATAAISRIVDVFPGHQQAHVRVQLASSLRAVVAQRLVPTVGTSARVPALERLIVNSAVANGIREGHEHHMQSAMQTGAADGMITLERSLAALERRGKITRDTAFRHAADQKALQKLLDLD